jgi:FkbM family methyltransferase
MLESIRRKLSPQTKRRVRRLLNSGYWVSRSIVRSGWRPSDPLPGRALDVFVARNEFGLYCVPRASKHRSVTQMISQARVWERETIELIRRTQGDAVHAGTFFGDFLPALSERPGTVWAFEPNSESFRCAQITILLNGLSNVVLTNAALGAAAGSAYLKKTDARGLAAGGQSRLVDDPSNADESVRILAIDESVDGRIGVIHLDVEGFEQPALEGALATIARFRPLIILESAPAAWISEHLMPLGYRVEQTLNGNSVLRCY